MKKSELQQIIKEEIHNLLAKNLINEKQLINSALVNLNGIKCTIKLKPIGSEPFSPMKFFIRKESSKPFTQEEIDKVSSALKEMNKKVLIRKGASSKSPSGLTLYDNLMVDIADLETIMLQSTLEKIFNIKNFQII